MKQRHYIDLHKGCTFFYIYSLIIYYSAYDNLTIWVYLGLHGTYGFLWVLKSNTFPDKAWENKAGFLYGIIIMLALSLYWVSPWIIVSGYFNNGQMISVPYWLISICIFLFGSGVFLHFSSDMQKFISLKLKPGHLVTGGLFSKSRNINYFGEFLIYISFAFLSMHWIPFILLLIFIVAVWVPNMARKERSLSRYSDYKKYKENTRWFFPF